MFNDQAKSISLINQVNKLWIMKWVDVVCNGAMNRKINGISEIEPRIFRLVVQHRIHLTMLSPNFDQEIEIL